MKKYKNFNLTNYNSYRICAYAKTAYFPETESELVELFSSGNFILIGNGNNIILSKEFYDENFIILNNCFNKLTIEKKTIVAEAGATTLDLSNFALKNSLKGCEFLYDIPSSIGGAIYMNAGTKEGTTEDIVEKVKYYDLNSKQVKIVSSEEIDFKYRNSYFQKHKNNIVLKAWFKLESGKYSDIEQKMSDSKKRRWLKQPRDFPNCGSVFKRPKNMFVGPMIDELGLKGFQIGGAKVSEKHSGFIINTGNASASDILNVIDFIKSEVYKKHKIKLKVEQRII